MNVRLLISSVLTYAAIKIAPKEMRSLTRGVRDLLTGLEGELSKGRTGGVAIVPWSLNKAGEDLSEAQARAAFKAVDAVRAEWVKIGAAVN